MKKLNFTHKIIIILLAVFLNCARTGATVQFIMNSFSIPAGGEILVPIKTINFDSLLAYQGTITFDTAVLTFMDVEQFGLPGMDATDFGTTPNLVDHGKFTYLWTDMTLASVTLPDSAVVFAIRFRLTGNPGLGTSVGFSGSPTQQEVDDVHFTTIPADYSKQLTIQCACTFAIAADANQLHHYLVTNYAFGAKPIHYDWNWGDGTAHDTMPYPSHTYNDSGFYNVCLTTTDANGCAGNYCDNSFHAVRTTNTMVGMDVVRPILVLADQNLPGPAQDYTIYPSPVNDKLLIDNTGATGESVYSIYTMLGQEIYSMKSGRKLETINCSSYPPGIYFLQIKSGSNTIVKRFVKSNP